MLFYIWIGIMVALGNSIADDVFGQVARDFRNRRGADRVKYSAGVACAILFIVTCWPAILTMLLWQSANKE